MEEQGAGGTVRWQSLFRDCRIESCRESCSTTSWRDMSHKRINCTGKEILFRYSTSYLFLFITIEISYKTKMKEQVKVGHLVLKF